MTDDSVEHPLRVTAVVVLAAVLVGVYFRLDWLLYSSLGFLVLALVSSTVNEAFAHAWMTLARWIGTINSKIILTAIFFLLLTPIAFLYRTLSGTPIVTVEEGRNRDSYFVERDKTFSPDDFENPW